jgi:flagellar export protein FliJ
VGKRFAFGLEAVLAHRQQREDAALQTFAVRHRDMEAASLELDRCREQLRAAERDLRGVIAAGQVIAAGSYENHVVFLHRSIDGMTHALAEAQAELGAAHEAVVDARRQRNVIEALRRRRLAEFEAAAMRAEQAEIDDANALRRSSSLSGGACHPERRRLSS